MCSSDLRSIPVTVTGGQISIQFTGVVNNAKVCAISVELADIIAPTVSVSAPANGSTVTGSVAINAAAADNVDVDRVVFYIDGVSASTDTSSPYSYAWNTSGVSAANHALAVRAYDVAGNSSLASITVNVADISYPTVPSALVASNISSAAFTLGWTAATDNVGVAGYRLDVSLNSGFTSFVAGYGNKDIGNVVRTNIAGLSAGTAYYARLRAYDAAGNVSPNSASLPVTTIDTSSPTVPAGLAASNVGGSAFTLGWTASTDNVGVVGYRLDVSLNSGFTSFVSGYNSKDVGAVTSSLISGLSDGVAYYARLRAYDAAGNVSANSASLLTTTLDVSSPTAPLGLAASNIGAAGFTLGWTAAADNVGVAGYRLDVSLNSGFTSFVTGYSNKDLGSVASTVVSGLSAQTPYYARLRAYDAAGNISANQAPLLVTTLAAPDVTAPNAPTGLVASNISDTGFMLGWTASTDNVGVTGYRLDVSLNSGFTSFVTGYSNLALGKVTSAAIAGLSAQTSYYVRLRAYDAAGNISANQAPLLVTTLAAPDVTAPNAPTGLVASNISDTGFMLGWTAATDNVGVTGYRLDVSLNSGFTSFVAGYSNLALGNVTSVAIAGLSAQTPYYARLRAYDAAGNISVNQAPLLVTTLAAPDVTAPNAPTGLAASNISDTGFTLGWAAATDNVGVTGYRLDVSLNSGFTSFVAGYSNLALGNVTSVAIAGLSAQTPYYARLRAYDAAGNVSANSVSRLATTLAAPDVTPPNAPTGLVSSNISDMGYTLGWSAATDNVGVSGYRLDVSLNSGFTSFVAGYNNLNLGNVTSVGISGLSAQTPYYARVRAYDAAGNVSANQSVLLTSTLLGPDVVAPNIPSGLVSSNISDTGFTLGWAAATDNVGVTGYRLDVSLNSGFTSFVAGYSNLALGNVTSVAIAGLSAQTPYYARLRAYDAAGNISANSASRLATTLAAPDSTSPNAPAGLVVSNISDTGFTLGWAAATDNVGVTGYQLDVSLNSGFTSFVAGYSNLALGNVTSVAIAGLSAQTPYYTRLRASDAAGNVSANSASGWATTLAAADVIVPVVFITAPSAGAGVSGIVMVSVAAADNIGVARVELYTDNMLKGLAAAAPYSIALDTTLLSNGTHVIVVKAYDAAGNSAQAQVTVAVFNSMTDITPPAVSITAPSNGATVSGTVYVTVSASDANGVDRVGFYVDNVLKVIDGIAPYIYKLNTLKFTNGVHVISVRAYDTGSNMAAASVSLTINNRQRTDAVVSSVGSVILAASASVTIAPMSITDPVLVSVVDESIDDDELLAEREARAKLQKIVPIAAGVRVLPENYTASSPIRIKVPVRRSATVSATMQSVVGIYAWDDATGVWTPLVSTYDPVDNTMNAETEIFSVYRLFSMVPVLSTPEIVGSVYVFPNPAKNGARPVFHIETETADKVEIKVIDFTGRVIHKKTLTGGPLLVNRNNQLVSAYEYEWDAKGAASGAYFYLIKISGAGGETIRKGKFAVIR